MSITISPEVVYRGDGGRFKAACAKAKARSVERCVTLGADRARFFAPEGEFDDDTRSIPLGESIQPVMLGAGRGVFVATARHAMFVEEDTVEHHIGAPGQVLASKARGFGPVRGPVLHPGTEGQHFMRRAYKIVREKMIGIMSQEYPG